MIFIIFWMSSLLSFTQKTADEIINIDNKINNLLEEAEMPLNKYRTVLSIDKYNQSTPCLGEIKIIEDQQHNEDKKYRNTRNKMLLDITESWQKNSENIGTKNYSDNKH